jgi:hypothetical protein
VAYGVFVRLEGGLVFDILHRGYRLEDNYFFYFEGRRN